MSITVYKAISEHNVTSEPPCPLQYIKQQVNIISIYRIFHSYVLNLPLLKKANSKYDSSTLAFSFLKYNLNGRPHPCRTSVRKNAPCEEPPCCFYFQFPPPHSLHPFALPNYLQPSPVGCSRKEPFLFIHNPSCDWKWKH